MTESIPASNKQSPGQALLAARKAHAMTTESVAAKLCWSSQRVTEIENDDYQGITAKIYAQGYLRAYARLMSLDESVLLKAFENLGVCFDEINDVPVLKSVPVYQQKSHSRLKWARWGSIVVAAVVILMVGLWWHGSIDNTVQPATAALTPQVQTLQLQMQAKLQQPQPEQKKAVKVIVKKIPHPAPVIKKAIQPSYKVTPVTNSNAG
jgi:cytoskeleton protein RodZ